MEEKNDIGSEMNEAPETIEFTADDSAFDNKDAEDVKEDIEEADSLKEELEKSKTQYMYLYAEYENYRKRTQKEKENLYRDAVAKVATDFLDVIDNIDLAVNSAASADENSIEKVVQGIEMLGKQAGDVLTRIGIEEIPAEPGTVFDPELHEAVMHVDDPDKGEQEITQVFRKGYKYQDKIIRHAVVQVAN